MSKGIDLKQAKLKDLNTILQMQKKALTGQNRDNPRQPDDRIL